MPELRQLVPADFEEIYRTFLASDDPRRTADTYRPMFASGVSLDDRVGYGLVDRGRLVGILGTIASRRVWSGQAEVCCNLHSWSVLPEYRGYSLLLMRPVLRMADWTLTDLSPTRAVMAIGLRLGFRPLDGRLTILRPIRDRQDRQSSGVEICSERTKIRERARTDDPTVRAAIDDATLQPLLLTDEKGECLVLARRVDRDCRPHCHVHHVSDPARFVRWSVAARNALLELCGGNFVVVDRRRIGDARLPRSITLPVSSRQLVRPGRVSSGKVDSLRSELQYLGMTTLPEKRLYLDAVKSRFRRLFQ